jgi:hypothetical protein
MRQLLKCLRTCLSVILAGHPFIFNILLISAITLAPDLLSTTLHLNGESKKQDVLKDTALLKKLNDIASFPDEDKKHILYTLDALIKNVKLKAI